MIASILARGMMAGVIAGFVCFFFVKAFGEPSIERAMRFESGVASEAGSPDHEHAGNDALSGHEQSEVTTGHAHSDEGGVTRATQTGIGLFIGIILYSTAFGGLFSIAFVSLQGRLGAIGPRATAGILALVGFLAIYAVPGIIYPANPPAVGDANTIRVRTALYFIAVAISLAGVLLAAALRRRLDSSLGQGCATAISGVAYLAMMSVVSLMLPRFNEIPDGFPLDALWSFRLASFGTQAIMWLVLGLVFGALADSALRPQRKIRASGDQCATHPAWRK
jgi:predicted cobalt transporter CbtA